MVNVNWFSAPPAVNVHAVAAVITLLEVGLEIPKLGGEVQDARVPASAGEKPVPDTVTVVPTAPEVGLREIVGVMTMNVA